MTLTITGPEGSLEASFHNPDAALHAALLCHPHPSYGGSMHDGVLGIATASLDACSPNNSWAHLRFNFRGVGTSSGGFDNGNGEQDDLCAAWNWLRAQGSWKSLALIGYSFGAAMAWAARERCEDLSKLILIAPPTAAMPFATGAGYPVPTHIIVGDNDDYCDLSSLPDGATTDILQGGDHFFSGKSTDLAEALVRCANE